MLSTSERMYKELSSDLSVEFILSEQDCTTDITPLCRIKKSPGQDSFFMATKILNMENACKTSWEIEEHPIGEMSENAVLYKGSCMNDDKKYALKFIGLKDKTGYQLKNIAREINIQHQIYLKYGLTTPIHQIFLNDDYLLFITDKLGMTVYRYIKNSLNSGKDKKIIIKQIIERCYDMTTLLMKEGIFHNDEHLNNFMLTDDFDDQFDPSKIKIIDFGKTSIDVSSDILRIKNRLKVISMIMMSNLNDFRFNKPPSLSSVSDLAPDIIK